MQKAKGNPTVELLIPVYKPGKELAELLAHMERQTWQPRRIHLLVTASQQEFDRVCVEYGADQTKLYEREEDPGNNDCVEKHSGSIPVYCTRIEPAEFDHGGTRHRGASRSRADILLFMTQDAVPADEYLVENMVRAFGENDGRPAGKIGEEIDECAGKLIPGTIAAVYVRQLPAADCHVLEQYTRQFNYPAESRIKTEADLPKLGIKTYFCSNVCAAYRREVYEELGGFERRTIFNEDMIFAAGLIKAGYGIAYAADARVIHSHNYSGIQQLHRNFDLAVSQAEHPEVFEGVPSEGEGIRMVKATAAYLCRTGKPHLLPKLVWQSGCKYSGYLLGKHYKKLPKKLVLWLTMNRRYWNIQGE